MKLVGAVWLGARCEGHVGPAPLSAQQLLTQPLLSPIITTMRVGFQATRGKCVRHQATTRTGEIAGFLQTQWPSWLPSPPPPPSSPASHPPPGAGRGGSPWPPTPPNRTAPRGRRWRRSTQCHRGLPRERRRLRGWLERVGREGGANGSCVTRGRMGGAGGWYRARCLERAGLGECGGKSSSGHHLRHASLKCSHRV